MNGCKVVFMMMMVHEIIRIRFLHGMQDPKREKQHRYQISSPPHNFYGNKVIIKKRQGDTKPGIYTDMLRKRIKVNKVAERGWVARDEVSDVDEEVSQLPYIALPPNNVLPDDEKKVINNTKKFGNRNTVTKQQIPVTPAPTVLVSGPPLILHMPNTKPPTHTTVPSPHPTPQPVNINLMLPTARPVIRPESHPVNSPQQEEESNVTKIDLSLNVGEEHEKQRPVVLQLPPTAPPPNVVDIVSQIQKAQEIKSQLSLLANPQLQKALQGLPFMNAHSAAASMLGLRNPYIPLPIEDLVSQNTYPYGYPPGILPLKEEPGLIPTLQQELLKASNPLTGLPYANQLAPKSSLSTLLSNAIKLSLSQSQPDLITSALNQAASQVQAQNQPPQLLTSALTQAIAKIVSQDTAPSEEQKLTEILAAAFNLAKSPESQKRFVPTSSSLKVEIVNPTNLPAIPVNQVLKQGHITGPGEQQIISLNVSPVMPQLPGITPLGLSQQNPGNPLHAGVSPQQNPVNSPALAQPNSANPQPQLPQNSVYSPPILPQQNTANTQALTQPNTAYPPQVLPPNSGTSAPMIPQQHSPANALSVTPDTSNASPIIPPQPKQPLLDQITARALGKAMAKALVHTAKKIVYNKSATQRDKISSNDRLNMVQFPRRLENFIQTNFFRRIKTRMPFYRTFSAVAGLNVFNRCFGPFRMKYLRHQCFCCC